MARPLRPQSNRLGLEPKLRSAKFTENTRNTKQTKSPPPLAEALSGSERKKQRGREGEEGISMCLVQIIVQAARTFLVVFIRFLVSFGLELNLFYILIVDTVQGIQKGRG